MKKLLTLALLSFGMLLPARLHAQTSSNPAQKPGVRTIARQGDTVWVIVNPVKADKRAQFEHFLKDIFWPMGYKLEGKDQEVFRKTRVLFPVKAEANGTYSYLFIMDPVVRQGEYDIETLLRKMYPADKAKEYNKLFDDSLSGGQIWYTSLQTEY
ncbi:hypothetical protein [Flaviaesturariibacter aridisoli]|uniref:Uncharacterized protein n=1 Tax=Flaviaesturariibacter aridisoli TaxID=2545761 RepID=A0A4R4DVQ8_9BACT|nr:hypothetical protein [Flaviaesturariibacter aridisoli]TCZ67736.1 hypothetical protein E0486_15355 [Flaviaesturariibacter aridisoli]